METQSHFIERLLEASKSRRTLDISTWHPTREVDSFMRITSDGRWFHRGGEIKRREMVALFAALLRCEGQRHFLVTPAEKAVIDIEDTPFLIVDFELDGAGEAARLIVRTNVDEWVAIKATGQIFMHPLANGAGRSACVDVRDGLLARASRAVHFRLAEKLVEREGWLGIWSFGVFHKLERAGDE
ncbi:MAG: DUF1285 domain-containing protein [Gammaproteobacteria bacterium]|nr:DUF1285 domain-containing protein [Gammaproteobacteria bacterium]